MMSTRLFLCAVALAGSLAVASSARAEEEMTLAGSTMVVLPQGDGDDVATTSLGLRASFGYWFRPFVAGVASFEYVIGNEKDGIEGDYSFYAIDFGVRFAPPSQRRVRPFGEILIGRHTASYDGPGFDDSQSDIGFRLGGGVLWSVGDALSAVAQLAYSTAEIENADVDSLNLELGLSWTL